MCERRGEAERRGGGEGFYEALTKLGSPKGGPEQTAC